MIAFRGFSCSGRLKTACLLCLAICFASFFAVSAGHSEGTPHLTVTDAPEVIYPGRTERITFTSDAAGEVSVYLEADGGAVFPLLEGYLAIAGTNHVTLDGIPRSGGVPEAGEYTLVIDMDGECARIAVTVGGETMRILKVSFPSGITAGDEASVAVECSMDGRIEMAVSPDGSAWHVIARTYVRAGLNSLKWDGLIDGAVPAPGRYALKVTGSSGDGVEGTARQITFTLLSPPTPVPTPAPSPTPAPVIPSKAADPRNEGLSYWTLPVGSLEDEELIWQVLMQPMTVIDGNQKETYKLRATPSKTGGRANIVGEITFASQGVHVLQDLGNGWTMIEAFNSSYGPDCESRRGYGSTDELITGYVETDLLKTVYPVTDYALLIDKMSQKLYIFSEGKIIGTLLISTGNPTKQQPWNETPSGEFLMVSKVGGFYAGNLFCDMAMRVNCGCLLHEVPYIGDYDYSSTVPKLGSKASHGCIRVQKDKNEQGQNMKWLWTNLRLNTKVLIWDDTGRFIPYPADDTVVYYNPRGGKYFHEDKYCSSVKKTYLPLAPTTYGALEELFDKPLPCPYCCTLKTKAQIDALNEKLK